MGAIMVTLRNSIFITGIVATIILSLHAASDLNNSMTNAPQDRRALKFGGDSGWTTDVRDALTRGLQLKDQPQTAVFDLDNTCIRNDIGEAVFMRMITEMNYRGGLPEFWSLFSPEAAGTLEDYWKKHRNDGQVHTLERIDEWEPDFRDYVVLFSRQYEEMLEARGPAEAYPWLTQLLVGFTEAEAGELSRRVWELENRRGMEPITLTSETYGTITISGGIRTHSEMKDLIRQLRDDLKWNVWIISASNHYSVRVVGEAMGVSLENIEGVRLRVTPDGRLTSELVRPVPYRSGKAQIMRDKGLTPSLVVGDSITDLEMLKESQIFSLVIERGKIPKSETVGPKWLFQPQQLLTLSD